MAQPTTTTKYKRYIPLLIKEELDQTNYKRIDNLYVIIDLIYSKNDSFRTKSQKEYGFSEIPYIAFKQFLSRPNDIIEDINYLINKGFVIRNNHYDTNLGKCKSYKIAAKYLSQKIAVTIQNKKINQKIKVELEKMRKAKVKNLDFQKSKYYKNFKIDHAGAIVFIEKQVRTEIKKLTLKLGLSMSDRDINDIINCTNHYTWLKDKIISKKNGGLELHSIMHRYMLYTVQVNRINDGYLYFKRNATNGRLDTNLTSLPTFLRPFLISENELVNVDLRNSQPFFFYSLIKDDSSIDKDELELYKSLVIDGGDGLYEFLERKKYDVTESDEERRKKMKKMIFKIYYSKVSSYKSEKQFFRTYFPTIMNFIDAKNSVENNKLAIELQTIESNYILDTIMVRLKSLNVVPYTIHDSFVCTVNEVNTITDIIKETSFDQFGVMPALHIESLTAPVLPTSKEDLIEDWEAFLSEDCNQDTDDDYKPKVEIRQLEHREIPESLRLALKSATAA